MYYYDEAEYEHPVEDRALVRVKAFPVPPQLRRADRLVGADLSQLALTTTRLTHAGLDPSRPTLFLSECVLTYVRPEDVAALLRWCAAEFRDSIFLNYEQIGASQNAKHFALTAQNVRIRSDVELSSNIVLFILRTLLIVLAPSLPTPPPPFVPQSRMMSSVA